jgi:3-isopropylmalate/(R)-2-methylmalate dehydratase large subunit
MLGILNRIGTGGGVGHVIEYRGEALRSLSMEGRMTVCNMSIEGGARAGLVAPDETTFEYLKDKPYAPKGEDWDRAVEEWRSLRTDEGAEFDKEVVIRAEDLVPYVSWGTTPAQTVGLDDAVPEPENEGTSGRSSTWRSRLVLRYARSRWTPSSLARVRTLASRTCAPPPPSSKATR